MEEIENNKKVNNQKKEVFDLNEMIDSGELHEM